MPKVSIVMPVHNEPENILRAAINSILNQTFTDFEFIIINDASQNNAEEVILSYEDKRIKYVKNEVNLKVIKTLNKGLNLATGEYIARMDADDISFKTRLEKQIQVLDANLDIGLINTHCYIFPKKSCIAPPQNHVVMEKILKYCVNCVVHPATMFRKSIIIENNLRYSEEHLHIEDYKLWIDMCNYTQLFTIQEPLLLHRDWGESVSNKNAIEQYFNARMLIFESMLKDANMYSENLLCVYKKFLLTQKISYEAFLDIELLVNILKKKTYYEISDNWREYILKELEQFRNMIYENIIW